MKLPKKYIVIGIGVVAITALVININSKKTATLPNTITIKRGDLVQEVSVTGRVKPSAAVELGFEKSGRVAEVNVNVGDHIKAGTVLAKIDSSSAEGSLKQAEARLAELKRGSRPEELDVKKAELAKDIQDLNNAYSGIPDILNDAFTKADDALHAKTTGVFTGSLGLSYRYGFSVCDTQLTNDGEWGRYTSETDFNVWRAENLAFVAAPTNEGLVTELAKTAQRLEKLSTFFDSVGQALSLDCTITNPALDTYRTNINTARTNINTALSNVNTKKQTIAALALTVQTVRDQLTLLEAGTAAEVVAAQEGAVLTAQGELAKYSISSPISGIITKVDIKKGEGSTVGAPVFSVISDASFKIEAFIPEADVAKVKIGDKANVTLDAYGSDVIFDAAVTEIDPAETIIDNVPTYKTTLHFTKNDSRIKSGMTANTDILTAARAHVLYAPGRSIISKNGEKYIRVVAADNTTSEIPVTTGLKASDGTVEIISGVSEGQTIITIPTE